jgi:hypothetical protein
MRRIFWAMGASTRIDVKLSALVARAASKGRSNAEEWTDLDVLAVEYTPLSGLTLAVADCKTLRGRVTERVFWLRGVADLFGAHAGYLTREEALPPSSRQLALRLGLTALDPMDRKLLLDELPESRLPVQGTFLTEEAFGRWQSLLAGAPKAIERLERFRRTGYWIVPRHRNLTYVVSQLQGARASFVPAQRWALAILADVAWLYLLAMLAALDDMIRLHLADRNAGLRQVVVGTEQEAREKERLGQQLARLFAALPTKSDAVPPVELLPPYFEDLSDLFGRLSRRRSEATDALRVLEFFGTETVAGRGVTWADAFPSGGPYAPKLASDVIRFLISSAGLHADFVGLFDRQLGSPSREEAAATEGVSEPQGSDEQQRMFAAIGDKTKTAREGERT